MIEDIKIFDGNDEIIFSKSFNVYESKLVIEKFLEKKFTFIFEKTEPAQDQKDISVIWSSDNSEVIVTLSKKFRNLIGAGTLNKMKILKMDAGKSISLSVFGSQFGEDGLNVTISFYIGQ